MPTTNPSVLNGFKEAAANAAVKQLADGMVVGLGSGTTSALAVEAIGKLVKDGLRIVGIPTSERIAEQARGLRIPLATLAEYPRVDITIDGADEVETGTLNLIKGGGGNLLREKIVAASSGRLIIVADQTKVVPRLGTRGGVPVEVVPFGWQATAQRLAHTGANPVLRLAGDGQAYLTDGGHYILDCVYGAIPYPLELQAALDRMVGVIEHGLFLGMASEAVVGGPEGVEHLRRA